MPQRDPLTHHLLQRLHTWFFADPESIETFLCLWTLSWGLHVLCFQPFTLSAAYRVLTNLAPDGVWGGAILSLAVLRSLALALDARRARVTFAKLCVCLWAFIWASVLLASWRAIEAPTILLIMLADAWVFIRLRCAEPFARRAS